MYSLNLNDRNVLITCDEVVKKVNVGSIDPHKFLPAIEVAEERFVRNVLGDDLYEALIAAKNVTVTEDNKTDLQTHITLKDGNNTYQLQVGDIVNAFELDTFTSEYKTLWKERLWKYTAECVYFVALSKNFAQFSTSGVVKNNPTPGFADTSSKGQAVDVSLTEIKWLNDTHLRDTIEPLRVSLEAFLCKNRADYPLYPAKRCGDCHSDGNKPAKTSNWVTGIYTKVDKRNRDNWTEWD